MGWKRLIIVRNMILLVMVMLILLYSHQISKSFSSTLEKSEETIINFDELQDYSHTVVTNVTQKCNKSVNILIQFVNAKENRKLQKNLFNFLVSLLSRTRCNITLYITSDNDGKGIAEAIFSTFQKSFSSLVLPRRIYLDISVLAKQLVHVIKPLQELFSSNANAYYKNVLFFIPTALHRVLPSKLSKIIMLDIDLQLRVDIMDLFAFFELMNATQIIAIAQEQQPVYWHITWDYRENNPGTLIGAPPPHGLTGFNSGVMLMNLDAMHNSKLYNTYLDDRVKLAQLALKYSYRGHLGDQDFYSLLSFEHHELFYILPCQWNRQFCEWWRHNGYGDIFDRYFNCIQPYHILHGNCDTPIPSNF